MRQNKRSGYPPHYVRSRRRYLCGCFGFVFVIGVIACELTYVAFYFNGPLIFAVVLAACFLWLLWVFYAVSRDTISIALYFEQKVAGEWVQSAVVARNCVYLDELCEKLGIASLSWFGFVDDWSGEKMVWHQPGIGAKTVAILIEQLGAQPDVLPESQFILADLQKMKNRLHQAEAKGARFCLILHGDSYNGMELDQRCGYF